MYRIICAIHTAVIFGSAHANNNAGYEQLAATTQIGIFSEISDHPVSYAEFTAVASNITWLMTMSRRIEKFIPDQLEREDFLRTVYYEATRSGLDPQLVLSVIQVESGFKKYAISHAGARGYMQIMPFWVDLIGQQDHNLFHLRINLRYGCTILRHYLDKENGDYFRALGRYNGSLGEATYPQMVFDRWRATWRLQPNDVTPSYQMAKSIDQSVD